MPHLAICCRCNKHIAAADKTVLIQALKAHFARAHKYVPEFPETRIRYQLIELTAKKTRYKTVRETEKPETEDYLIMRLSREEYRRYQQLNSNPETRGQFRWAIQHQKMKLKAAAARAR